MRIFETIVKPFIRGVIKECSDTKSKKFTLNKFVRQAPENHVAGHL